MNRVLMGMVSFTFLSFFPTALNANGISPKLKEAGTRLATVTGDFKRLLHNMDGYSRLEVNVHRFHVVTLRFQKLLDKPVPHWRISSRYQMVRDLFINLKRGYAHYIHHRYDVEEAWEELELVFRELSYQMAY